MFRLIISLIELHRKSQVTIQSQWSVRHPVQFKSHHQSKPEPRAHSAAAAPESRTTLNGTAPPRGSGGYSHLTTMSSPTSVDFLPRRLESIAVSPVRKKKRIKIAAPAPSEPSYPVVANLRDLPSDLLCIVLAFLAPNNDHPVHSECDCVLVGLSRVSKSFRALALNDQLWHRICVDRWETNTLSCKSRTMPSRSTVHPAISSSVSRSTTARTRVCTS